MSDVSREALEERFWAKVDIGAPDDCWMWTASGGRYGRFYDSRIKRGVAAHRFAYQLLVGLIPEGLMLDHLCRNSYCVNPAHLEPVTNTENTRRGGWRADSPQVPRSRCKRGHEYTPENTKIVVKPGISTWRSCIACQKQWDRESYERKKARDPHVKVYNTCGRCGVHGWRLRWSKRYGFLCIGGCKKAPVAT